MKKNISCKTPAESYTEMVQIVSQGDLNGYSRLFGGKLMQWIDIVAGVCARRHSECNVTTAMVDGLEFQAPAYANDIIFISAKVTYTGKTSMEVCVESYVEKKNGRRNLINRAYLIMVAMDEKERPVLIPKIKPQTEKEKIEWNNGRKRYLMRKDR